MINKDKQSYIVMAPIKHDGIVYKPDADTVLIDLTDAEAKDLLDKGLIQQMTDTDKEDGHGELAEIPSPQPLIDTDVQPTAALDHAAVPQEETPETGKKSPKAAKAK